VNTFIRALADVCRGRLLAEKWLIAPSLRVGHQWLAATARGGQPAVNLRIKTLLHMALDLAGPAMARDGLSLLNAVDGQVLMGRVWERLAADDGYLLGLEPTPGLLESVLSSLRDVRLAALAPDAIPPQAFEVPSKGQELARLLETYVEELAAASRVDHADVLRMATRRLREEPAALGEALLLVPEDMELAHRERALLDAVLQEQLAWMPVDEPCTPLPHAPQEPTDLSRLRWLPRPGDAPAVPERPVEACDGAARIVRAVGEVNEVRGALRRILAEEVPLDEVEFLHTDRETYVPLIYELVAGLRHEHGDGEDPLPVTFAEGLPARMTRPGRALRAWLLWQREGYPQTTLVRMVQDGLLAPPESDGTLGFARLANLLRAVPIGLERERYLRAIDRKIEALTRRIERATSPRDDAGEPAGPAAEELAQQAEELHAVRRLVESVLDATPAADASQADVLAGARTFIEKLARAANADDEYARRALLDEIELLGAWVADGEAAAHLDVRAWLAELPRSVRIKGRGPRPGRLHVDHVMSGGHSGRPHTMVLGLDDSRFPGQGAQDPVVLDDERQKLSDALPTAAGRLQEKLDRFARLLARLRGRVTLSYSCRDLEDDRETFASPVLLAAYRILSGKRSGDHADLDAWLPTPESFAPADPAASLDDADWWLWRMCGPQAVGNAVEIIREQFPRLERGRGRREHRSETSITAYDGLVPDAGRDLDPTAPDGPVLSASRLQTLGACPLRYFFRYVLDVEPPEELEIDPSRWLDPLAFGSLLHEVFCQFIRELRDEERLPKFERDRERLDALLERRVQRCLEDYPPPNDDAFRRQQRELERTAHTFLREEELLCAESTPLYCEAALGLPADEAGTEIDTRDPLPLTLPDGKTLRIRGRIDRIDQVGDPCRGIFAVWDYKTGGTSQYDRADPFRQGRVVQNLISLRLTEARLRQTVAPDARVERFGYFFPGVRAHGERIAWTPEELAPGREVVARLAAVAASGCFPATNTTDDCRYCDYRPICGDDAELAELTQASQAKLEEASNTILQPFRKLRSSS
jgi:ATP-dependent helicase/nuclease subunit B